VKFLSVLTGLEANKQLCGLLPPAMQVLFLSINPTLIERAVSESIDTRLFEIVPQRGVR
jgi:hypothetical protein